MNFSYRLCISYTQDTFRKSVAWNSISALKIVVRMSTSRWGPVGYEAYTMARPSAICSIWSVCIARFGRSACSRLQLLCEFAIASTGTSSACTLGFPLRFLGFPCHGATSSTLLAQAGSHAFSGFSCHGWGKRVLKTSRYVIPRL